MAPLSWEISQLPLKSLPDSSKDHILTYADDTALLASNTEDIIKIFELTSTYAKDFGIDINAKKSGYAYINTKQPASNLQYNKQALPLLGADGCYKYLGIYINLNLNFSQHYKIMQNKYQNTVKAIFSLKKIGITNKITLINAAASALLMYTMNTLVFPKKILEKLEKWTAKQIKKNFKASNDTSTRFLYSEFNLQQLTQLNYTLYTNTQVVRTLNRPQVLSHKGTVQNNTNLPTFSHHTEKTKYSNQLLKEGGPIPVKYVLDRLNIELID